MVRVQGTWRIEADAGVVRLRSGRIGLVTIDVQAPVTSGLLVIDEQRVRLTLELRLDRLRTGNPLMQVAARALVTSHQASALAYRGEGAVTDLLRVQGVARAGTVEVDLALQIDPIEPSMTAVEIRGSAEVGTVHLPLPGLGTVRDLAFDVEARLALQR